MEGNHFLSGAASSGSVSLGRLLARFFAAWLEPDETSKEIITCLAEGGPPISAARAPAAGYPIMSSSEISFRGHFASAASFC